MKIKEQTRKLAAGCSKHSFEVSDKTDVVWRDFRRVWQRKNERDSFPITKATSHSSKWYYQVWFIHSL